MQAGRAGADGEVAARQSGQAEPLGNRGEQFAGLVLEGAEQWGHSAVEMHNRHTGRGAQGPAEQRHAVHQQQVGLPVGDEREVGVDLPLGLRQERGRALLPHEPACLGVALAERLGREPVLRHVGLACLDHVGLGPDLHHAKTSALRGG